MKPENTNWRDEAMNEALRAEAEDGQSYDALLRQIRIYNPQSVVLDCVPNRLQLMRFLETQASSFHSLLTGIIDYDDEDGSGRIRPYLGWYQVEWNGKQLELALVPSTYDSGGCFCIGDDATSLCQFIKELAEYAERPLGRALRYSCGWHNSPELDEELGKVTWADVVLPEETMITLREAVEGFFKHREAYETLGFSWRRGILLIGPPGTGKTMICKAAAAALPDLPFLYVRDLREEKEKEALKVIFKRARKLAPCILAFEDIDGLVNPTTRTVFLNEVDGFHNNEGLLVLASSNYPEKIDEALLTRPSRFDRVLHIGLPKTKERAEYCRRVLTRSSLAKNISPDLDVETLAQDVATRSEGFTPAYLKEALIAAALRRAQDGATVLDTKFGEAILEQVEELKQHLKRAKNPEAMAAMSSGGAIGFRR